MTREEAIKILKAIRVYECYPKSASEETKEAIDMAIEALKKMEKGEWVLDGDTPICSVCHEEPCWSGEGYAFTDYCPYCGARMTL